MRIQKRYSFDAGEFEYLYSYEELPDETKDELRRNYLDINRDAEFFTEYCQDYIKDLFGHAADQGLKVGYSLNYCQGDGLIIYGDLYLNTIVAATKDSNSEWARKGYASALLDSMPLADWAVVKQTDLHVGGIIRFKHSGRYANWGCMTCEYDSDYLYDTEASAVEIVQSANNELYTEALDDMLSISDDDERELACVNYVIKVLEALTDEIISYIKEIADHLEQRGYDYFYEAEDADIKEFYSWQAESETGNIVFDNKGRPFESKYNIICFNGTEMYKTIAAAF